MPVLSKQIIVNLLGSIEAGNLVLLCGAGLSVPAPSSLLPAWQVAEICYDKRSAIERLPVALRSDLDALAGHFYDAGHFKDQFINLVPWEELLGEPNAGHAAVSDLLVSRALHSTLSANFDPLIEMWAKQRKTDMRGALDGVQASRFNVASSPLLKFHGCLEVNREDTLWTQRQLDDPNIKKRIQSIKGWLANNLPGRDLLIVGFWTDWGYFNDVLAEIIAVGGMGRVVVIDPKAQDELREKAPGLWGHLKNAASFEHVVGSGDEALQELRSAFLRAWADRFFRLAKQMKPDFVPPDTASWTCEDLYNLRQDAEGVPYNRAAKEKAPSDAFAQAALAHAVLVGAGAQREGAWYRLNGKTIRIVQGGGRALAMVRQGYNEPSANRSVDIVICAGSTDNYVPPTVIPSGIGGSVVRSCKGGTAKWLTLDQARGELGL